MSMGARLKAGLEVITNVAVIIAAAVLVWAVFFRQPTVTASRQQVEDVKDLRLDAAFVRHQLGNARVAIVEFADYQCPFCSKHASATLPSLKEQLVQSGKIRYVALHYPIESIHAQALQAALAAECAGQQGEFWTMHEKLFASSKDLRRADLEHYAQELKLDLPKFEHCVDQEGTKNIVKADKAEGTRLGVNSTPVFFVGIVGADGSIRLITRINGAVSSEVFVKEVENVTSSLLSS